MTKVGTFISRAQSWGWPDLGKHGTQRAELFAQVLLAALAVERAQRQGVLVLFEEHAPRRVWQRLPRAIRLSKFDIHLFSQVQGGR